jgi:hypothetical protein
MRFGIIPEILRYTAAFFRRNRSSPREARLCGLLTLRFPIQDRAFHRSSLLDSGLNLHRLGKASSCCNEDNPLLVEKSGELQKVWTPFLNRSAPRLWRGSVPRAPVPSCLFANLSSPWGPWGIGTGSTLGTYPVVPIMCFALAGRSFSFTAASGIGTKAVRSRGCRNPEGNSGGQNSRGINNGIARTWRASLIGAGSAKSTQLADGWINHIPTFT